MTTELPSEIWMYIFAFLDADVLYEIGRVCKEWYSCANDRNLWQIIAKSYALSYGNEHPRDTFATCSIFYVPQVYIHPAIREYKTNGLPLEFEHKSNQSPKWKKVALPSSSMFSKLALLIVRDYVTEIHVAKSEVLVVHRNDTFTFYDTMSAYRGNGWIFKRDCYTLTQVEFHFCSLENLKKVRWIFRTAKDPKEKIIRYKWHNIGRVEQILTVRFE